MKELSEKQLADLISENLQLKQQLEFSKKYMANSNYWETYRDKSGNILYTSPNLNEVLGTKKGEYLNGNLQITNFIHDNDIEKTIDNYKKVMQGQEVPPHKCRLKSNLSFEYVLIDYKRVYDDDGQFNGIRTCISDITELEKKEKNIRNNEEFLRNITDNIPALIGHIDNDLKYTYANKRYADYSGVEVEKIIGSNVISIISEDTFKVSYPYMLRALSGESVSFETSYKNSEGKVFYFKSNYVPNIENNQVNGFTVLAWDVTDLKKSEAEIRLIVKNITDIVFRQDVQTGKYLYISESIEKIFKYTVAEAMTTNFNEANTDQTYIDTVEQMKQQINKFFSGDETYKRKTYQYKQATKYGELVWIETQMTILKGQDNKYELIGFIRDIDKQKRAEIELKESEEKYRTIIEATDAFIANVNIHGELTYVNSVSNKIYGLKPEECIGRNAFDFIHPDDKELTKNKFTEWIESDTNNFEFENRQVSVNDKVHYLKWNIRKNRTETGEFNGFSSIAVDVTKQKQIESALKENEIQLKELNATKDKLFSIIAHDLRNPFNNIIGLSELSMENETDITRHLEFDGIINSTAKNTLELLENLLNWSKSQTGKLDNKPKKIVLSSLLNKVKENASAQATVKNISINILQPEETEVYADENMVNTIFRNLISNAIKYSYPGGRINVIAIQQKNNVEISVSDNGVGIPKSKLNQLFKISSETQSLGTANEKGSGLGLILCKEFVEKLGGKIWVESIEGKGSNFKFTIPSLK
jgi:Signal transduction histidine kinase